MNPCSRKGRPRVCAELSLNRFPLLTPPRSAPRVRGALLNFQLSDPQVLVGPACARSSRKDRMAKCRTAGRPRVCAELSRHMLYAELSPRR